MSNNTNDNAHRSLQITCVQVGEHIDEVVQGTADPRLLEHIAECDACRDLRFDAEAAINAIKQAGADYVHPENFDTLLDGKLDSAKSLPPSQPQPPIQFSHPQPESIAATQIPEPTPLTDQSPEQTQHPQPTTDAPIDAASNPEPTLQPTPIETARNRGRTKLFALGFAAAATLCAAAGAAIWLNASSTEPSQTGMAWSATVSSLKVAGKSDNNGLEQCNTDGSSCVRVPEGAILKPPTLLRTDSLTRVILELADGTNIALDRTSELALGEAYGRVAQLKSGMLIADVAHLDDEPNAVFPLPHGTVRVLGTKFAITATDSRSSVEVVRGVVELSPKTGSPMRIRAGEEGTIASDNTISVVASPALGESLKWGELSTGEPGPEDAVVLGLGELRAKKPGTDGELNQAVTLTKHDVKVRISGQTARTEIDEVFSNSSGDVLEGIYRFPLPPDAQIERLALEVDGHLEEGAFEDKGRAAAIWRGVINAATPKSPTPRDEIIWVPGPWKDPALLEWQRGGRFELRIFPIPAKGSRRIVLAYTQHVPKSGGVRKYTYPLTHDQSGSTRIEQFNMDVQIRGFDTNYAVRSRGYSFEQSNNGNAEQLNLSAKSFVPSGDITV
ncbi:MAG: FecR domain-containing protein, partial [Polyangiaceae bacterium]|nr:FecR domain-containing protein [Polyangiaceae bacterium]